MKMHTFFLSGKALAIIGGGLAVSGVLLFTTGIFVGVGIESVLVDRVSTAAAPARLASATPAESTAVSGAATSDPSAWPFGPPDPNTAAPVDSAPPAKPDSAKAKPAGKPAVIGLADYQAPVADAPVASPPVDTTTYLIQVGAFRVERNARELAARLKTAGYRASIIDKDDGDLTLHVVRVGRFTGLAAAERASEKIGDAERLVAQIVAAPSGRADRE